MKHLYPSDTFVGYVSCSKNPLKALRMIALAVVLTTCSVLNAQLTIKVTAVPMNTPADANIYAAGSFNNWNPADPNRLLTSLGNGKYMITINPAPGQVEFKFTRGSWNSVEGNIGGLTQPSHKIYYNGQPKTVEVVILSWPDLMNGNNSNIGQVGGSINVLDENYFIPQLNRTRRIWAYLPPDYALNPNKRYPVLYMQDGQNLFDPTSTTSDWKIDEAMNALAQNGDAGCIIVGIDNGGSHKNDEYSPWSTASYGGGQGAEYVNFIVSTLKPYIDNNYLTLSDRDHTGIMGSSMGGLISMYALIEHQETFSKAGIFSPTFSFNGTKMAEYIASKGKLNDVRVFFLAGGLEPNYIGLGVELVYEAMLNAGFDLSEINMSNPADGEHSEWFWGREFPSAYTWLFKEDQASVSSNELASEVVTLQAYPNPSTNWVQLQGNDLDQLMMVRITGMDGRVWHDAFQLGSQSISTSNLPKGAFSITVSDLSGRSRSVQMIHV